MGDEMLTEEEASKRLTEIKAEIDRMMKQPDRNEYVFLRVVKLRTEADCIAFRIDQMKVRKVIY